MTSKKVTNDKDKVRKKLTLNKETLKDLTPSARQGNAVKGGAYTYATCSVLGDTSRCQ